MLRTVRHLKDLRNVLYNVMARRYRRYRCYPTYGYATGLLHREAKERCRPHEKYTVLLLNVIHRVHVRTPGRQECSANTSKSGRLRGRRRPPSRPIVQRGRRRRTRRCRTRRQGSVDKLLSGLRKRERDRHRAGRVARFARRRRRTNVRCRVRRPRVRRYVNASVILRRMNNDDSTCHVRRVQRRHHAVRCPPEQVTRR